MKKRIKAKRKIKCVYTMAQVKAAIPSNWLDSLLTGKDGIGRPPYDCPCIDQLFARLRDTMGERLAAHARRRK